MHFKKHLPRPRTTGTVTLSPAVTVSRLRRSVKNLSRPGRSTIRSSKRRMMTERADSPFFSLHFEGNAHVVGTADLTAKSDPKRTNPYDPQSHSWRLVLRVSCSSSSPTSAPQSWSTEWGQCNSTSSLHGDLCLKPTYDLISPEGTSPFLSLSTHSYSLLVVTMICS
jgi:hypothetical protein